MSTEARTLPGFVEVDPEVREAIGRGRAVALETSVVAQGLPAPHNLEAARRCAAAVRATGAVPAAIALVGGKLIIGASEAQLERLADPARKPGKAGVRDLGAFLAARHDAGTTVSATCFAAALAGIRLFATGGIGGVHRRGLALGGELEPPDVSSDLSEMARRAVCVVSAGPKLILDVPATAEHLESLAVPIIGFQTDQLPAFYSGASGIALEHTARTAAEAAHMLSAHWALGLTSGVLLAVAPPQPLPSALLEEALAAALAEARARGIGGKALTPFLLGALAERTSGRTLAANLALLEKNARVAGEVTVEMAALDHHA